MKAKETLKNGYIQLDLEQNSKRFGMLSITCLIEQDEVDGFFTVKYGKSELDGIYISITQAIAKCREMFKQDFMDFEITEAIVAGK